jgi:hypothetical protein
MQTKPLKLCPVGVDQTFLQQKNQSLNNNPSKLILPVGFLYVSTSGYLNQVCVYFISETKQRYLYSQASSINMNFVLTYSDWRQLPIVICSRIWNKNMTSSSCGAAAHCRPTSGNKDAKDRKLYFFDTKPALHNPYDLYLLVVLPVSVKNTSV